MLHSIRGFQNKMSKRKQELVNVDIDPIFVWKPKNSSTFQNSFYFPNSLRAILVGQSGCGKTTTLMNLLLNPHWLDYDNLLIYGASLHQEEYQVMEKAFKKKLSKEQIKQIFKNQKEIEKYGGLDKLIDCYDGPCNGNITANFYSIHETPLPDPINLDPKKKNLLILDDIMTFNSNCADDYFTRGRHNNINVIYITQSYHKLPRHTIRQNSNFNVLFNQDNTALSHIYQDCFSGDSDILPYQRFKNLCNKIWDDDKYNFITIDKTKNIYQGKYRKNFNEYWIPTQQDAN